MADYSYCRKTYSGKFLWGMLGFRITSEDRGNGEYKHMVEMKFLWKPILSIVYRTGKTECGTNTSIGFFKSGKICIEDIEDSEPYSRVITEGRLVKTILEKGNLLAEIAVEPTHKGAGK